MGFKIKIPKVPALPKIAGIKAPPVTQGAANAINAISDGNWDRGRHELQMVTDPGYKYIWSDLDKNKKGPTAPAAGEDPNVSALRNRLYGSAQEFEQGLPGMMKSASDQIQREGDLASEKGVRGTRQNFNRRGLLYSGLREGGEQDVRGRVASTMSSQKAQSNQELGKLAVAKYQTAAQAGLQGYQDAVNREAEIAGINLQNQVARAQVMQQLGQATGQGLGNYYGGRNNRNLSQEFKDGNLAADST